MNEVRNRHASIALLVLMVILTPCIQCYSATLTAFTDSSSYYLGETVIISVRGVQPYRSIELLLYSPLDSLIWTWEDSVDGYGTYEKQLNLLTYWPTGSYILQVDDPISGALDTVTFTVSAPPTPTPPPTPEEIEELPPEEAAEVIGEMTPEDAADILKETELQAAVAIFEELMPETAGDIADELPAEVAADIIGGVNASLAADIIGEVSTEHAADILEEVFAEDTADIVEAAVKGNLTRGVSQIMLVMGEEAAADVLVKVDPDPGADVVGTMTELDVTQCARLVEAAVFEDVEATADILEGVLIDALIDLLIEIAKRPSTPSTVAAVFEAMSIDKVLEVVRVWASLEPLQELGEVLSYLTPGTLNSVFGGLTVAERAAVSIYLSSEALASLSAEILLFPDLTPTLITVSRLGSLDYALKVPIKNQGNVESGRFKVELRADTSLIDLIEVSSLPPDASTTVTFEWKPTAMGSYTLKAIVDPDNAIEEIDETNNEQTKAYGVGLPELVVSFKTVPTELVEDETYTIEVEVSNIGEEVAGAFSIMLEADGVGVGSMGIQQLAVGASETLQFSWTPEAAGAYTLKVTVDLLDEIVEGDETNNIAQTAETVETKLKPLPWAWIITAVIALLAVLTVLYFVLKKQRWPLLARAREIVKSVSGLGRKT